MMNKKQKKKHYIRYLPIVQIVPDMFCIFCPLHVVETATKTRHRLAHVLPHNAGTTARLQPGFSVFELGCPTVQNDQTGLVKLKKNCRSNRLPKRVAPPNSTDPDPRAKSLPAIVKPKRTSNQKPWRCLKNKCTLEFLMGKMSKLKM
jgi:hypothetical protein